MLNAFGENLRHSSGSALARRHAYVLAGIAQMKLAHRPGRVEPRAVKLRPKPHKLLTEPKPVMRARLLQQQQRHFATFLLTGP